MMKKVSSPSTVLSPVTSTETVVVVLPAAMVAVPLAAA